MMDDCAASKVREVADRLDAALRHGFALDDLREAVAMLAEDLRRIANEMEEG